MAKNVAKERKQGEMRVYVEEEGKLFPFSMSIKQFGQYKKSKKDNK